MNASNRTSGPKKAPRPSRQVVPDFMVTRQFIFCAYLCALALIPFIPLDLYWDVTHDGMEPSELLPKLLAYSVVVNLVLGVLGYLRSVNESKELARTEPAPLNTTQKGTTNE